MKKLFTLTLLALLTTSCSNGQQYQPSGRGSTMTNSVRTQAELDEANQRIIAFKQELLREGFREISVSTSNTVDQFILEGEYGRLKDLRVTLKTNKQLEDDKPEVAGGIEASLTDEQAEKEFEELYGKVVVAVTGRPL